jgi:hypothetical protein
MVKAAKRTTVAKRTLLVSKNGMSLGGDDHFRIQNETFDTFELDFTYIPSGALGTLVSLNGQSNPGFFWSYIDSSTNRIYVQCNRSTGTPNYGVISNIGTILIPGRRYKIKVVISTNGIKVFIDDELVTTSSDTYVIPIAGTLHLGSYTGGTTHRAKSVLHSFKWWKDGSLRGDFKFNELPSYVEKFGNPLTIGRKAVKVPKKNLIPAFNSGKWTLHANAKAKSAYELELVANGTYQHTSVSIPVLPNTIYTLSCSRTLGGAINVVYYSNGVYISETSLTVGNLVVTTPANCNSILIRVNNGSNATGTFTFTDPQLEQGNTATPFEPYTEVNKPSK